MTKKNTLSRRQFLKGSIFVGSASLFTFKFNSVLSQEKIRILSGFKNPYDIVVSQQGFIYVSDSGHYCIKVFDSDLNFIKQIGKPGSSGKYLNFPLGIAVDENEHLYILDSNNGRILIVTSDGEYISEIGNIGGYPGAFYTPKGICLCQNKIIVTNTRNHLVYIYDKNTHQLLASLGLLGEDPVDLARGSFDYRFRLPTGVAVNSESNIYVVDSKHGEIKILDENGGFQSKFGTPGSHEGQFNYPEGIAIDSKQYLYVCDTLNKRIQKFAPDGSYQDKIDQGFKKPTGIYIDNEDRLYIVDSEDNLVKILRWS